MTVESAFILVGLFFSHFLADYTYLSTTWMLSAKRFGTPLHPIFVHALVHASLMSAFIWVYISYVVDCWHGITGLEIHLFFTQLITHFLIDVWKGRMNGWFPVLQSPVNKSHWVIFGFDQLLHALVIIGMTAYLFS